MKGALEDAFMSLKALLSLDLHCLLADTQVADHKRLG